MPYKFNPFTGNLDLVNDEPGLVTSTNAGLIPAPPEGEPTGKVFTDALEWADPESGSATPAGSGGDIQFNDGEDPAQLAASADLNWDDTEKVLAVGGDINLDDGGTYTTTLQMVTPTANRTISFPNATGTVGLVAGSSGNLVANQAGAYAGVANSSVDNATGNITLGSRFISSLNGAASAPPGAFTGTWFTGGTATTTKPQVLIEPAGTTSTNWSTAGTGLGVNAPSGFTGNLLDLQQNGTSRFVVTGSGTPNFICTTAYIGLGSTRRLEITSSGAVFKWNDNSAIYSLTAENGDTTVIGYGTGYSFLCGTTRSHIYAVLESTGASNSQSFSFRLPASGTTREVVKIASNGTHTWIDGANLAVGTTTGTKIGTATTQKLAFFNATPVVQPSAVADLTTTATAGTLPTPDGSVTIADAATPTVAELLEYCVELEAKLEAALGHLRTLGLIAT